MAFFECTASIKLRTKAATFSSNIIRKQMPSSVVAAVLVLGLGVGAVAGGIVGCAGTSKSAYSLESAGKLPASFASRAHPDYPQERYWLETGTGTSPEVARSAAMRALAFRFNARVEGTVQGLSEESFTEIGGKTSGQYSEERRETSTVSTEFEHAALFEPVQEAYVGDTGTYYALVALDRRKAVNYFRTRLDEGIDLLERSGETLSGSKADMDGGELRSQFNAARDISRTLPTVREDLNNLMVLEAANRAFAGDVSDALKKADRIASDFFNMVIVDINLESRGHALDDASRNALVNNLTRELQKMGFTVSEDGKRSDSARLQSGSKMLPLRAVGILGVEWQSDPKMHLCRGTIAVNMVIAKTGETLWSVEFDTGGGVGGQTRDEAVARVVRVLNNKLEKHFASEASGALAR